MSRPYASIHELSREDRASVYMAHRIRYLPTAIDNARRNLRALENEAARYGMTELLADPRDA